MSPLLEKLEIRIIDSNSFLDIIKHQNMMQILIHVMNLQMS